MQTLIQFSQIKKSFGNNVVLKSVNFEVGQGEFFAMLGPSGSGKTTCLRMVAGFDTPDEGEILLEGQSIANMPTYQRPVNTVFQDYALFPHMSVLDNVAYGMMIKGLSQAARHKEAMQMLELVRLKDLAYRRPSELSGGQKQRIALARALANKPKILLLDEPLGALDLKLREAMQAELKQLQKQLGLTFIYVTHDQGEALSMADRVAVFNEGRIEQVDSPQGLYNNPSTQFVARFVGSANVWSYSIFEQGHSDHVAVRPEYITLSDVISTSDAQTMSLPVQVDMVLYQGAYLRVECTVVGHEVPLLAHVPADHALVGQIHQGARLNATWLRSKLVTLTD